MAQHNFNPFYGENPFELRGVYKLGGIGRWREGEDRRKDDKKEAREAGEKRKGSERRADRRAARQAAKENSSGKKEVQGEKYDRRDRLAHKRSLRETLKALDHAQVSDEVKAKLEAVLIDKTPILDEIDIERLVQGAKLMEEAEELKADDLPDDKAAELDGFVDEYFGRDGKWSSGELAKFRERLKFFKAANERLKVLDDDLKDVLEDSTWGDATESDLDQAIMAAEQLDEIDADTELSDEKKEALRAQMGGGDLEDWDRDRLIQQAEQIREARLAIDKSLDTADIEAILNSNDKETILANAAVFFRRADGDRARINPKLESIPYGSYVFDPGNNKLAYNIIKLQSLNDHIEDDSILVDGEKVTRSSGGTYNEGKRYGQAGYVALERGTMITIKQPEIDYSEMPEDSDLDHERREALEAEMDASDLEIANTLHKRDYVKIPRSLRGNEGRVTLRTDFDNLRNGEFLLQQLSILGEISGMVSGSDAYNKTEGSKKEQRRARRRQRKADTAPTHVVDSMEVWNELRKDFLRIGSAKISYKEISKVVLRNKNADEMKDLIGEENFKRFQLASLRLLNGIDDLSRVEESEMAEAAPDFTFDDSFSDGVTNTWAKRIFDLSNEGTVRHGLFGKSTYGKEVTMHSRKEAVKTNELSYSQKRGYLYLTEGDMYLDGDKGYKKTIDKEQSNARLNELYQLGRAKMSLTQDVSGMPDSIDWDYVASNATLPEDVKLAIHKGMETKFGIQDSLDTVRVEKLPDAVAEQFQNTAVEGLLLYIKNAYPDVTDEKLLEIGTWAMEEHEKNLANTKSGVDIGVGQSYDLDKGMQRTALDIGKGFRVGENDIYIGGGVSGNAYNYFVKDKKMKPSVNLGAGISRQLGDHWTVGAGAGIDSSGMVGGSATITYTFGDAGIHSAYLGLAYGQSLDQTDLAAVGLMAGWKRDLGAVLDRNVSEEIEARSTEIDRITGEILEMDGIKDLPPHERAALVPQIEQQLREEVADLEAEELKAFQLTGVGVGVGAQIKKTTRVKTGVLFGISFGIKSKNRFLLLSPKHPRSHYDEITRSKFAQAIIDNDVDVNWDELSEEVDVNLALTDQGEVTYQKSEYVPRGAGSFGAMQEAFAKNKILVQREGDKIRLDALDVHGEVRIKTAPGSQVETYVEGGKVYLNLNEADGLFIARRDVMYDRPQFGDDHEVTLFIGSEPTSNIDWMSGDRTIVYKKSDSAIEGVGGASHSRSGARTIESNTQTGLWHSESYKNEAELGDKITTFATEDELREAQAGIDAVVGAQPFERTSETFHKDVEAAVAKIIREGKMDYATVVNPENRRMVKARLEKELGPLNGTQLAYAINELVMESRANFPGGKEAFVNHVMGWNQRSLRQNIIRNNPGIAPETADKIALKVVESYRDEIEASFEDPDSAGVLVDSPAFSTNIAGGNGETAWMVNGAHEEIRAIHPRELSPSALADEFDLDHLEALQFYQSQMKEMFPLPYADPNNPKAFMHSAIPMMILKDAANIFGREQCQKIRNMLTMNKVTSETSEIWNTLVEMAKSLQKYGSAEYGPSKLKIEGVQIGFAAKCGNFSRFGGTLSVASTRMAIDAQVDEHLGRQKAVKYVGLGVGGLVTWSEKDNPPTPKRKGSKEDGGNFDEDDQESPRGDTDHIPESGPDDWEDSRDDPAGESGGGSSGRPGTRPRVDVRPENRPGAGGTKPGGGKPGSGKPGGGKPGSGKPGGGRPGGGRNGGETNNNSSGDSSRPEGEGPSSSPV